MADLLDTDSKAPILYITAGSSYDGVLMKAECTATDLWQELTQQEENEEVRQVLLEWQQRLFNESSHEEKHHEMIEISINDITPFRMIVHKLERLKMVHSKQNGHRGSSECKHFALLWVPTNPKVGMNKDEYNAFRKTLENSSYFCNKLNKDCAYISGPGYGHSEHKDEEKVDYNHAFDLEKLVSTCRGIGGDRLPKHKTLDIEIAVHQLANEYSTENDDGLNIQNRIRVPRESTGSARSSSLLSDPSPIEMQGPLPKDGFAPIYDAKSALNRDHFVFALVWFHLKSNHHHVGIEENDALIDDAFELPAWSVMKKMHQQPYMRSLVYTVELFNYAECWENQDLVVDRKILWKEAFFVLLQFWFLPIFAVIPLRDFVHVLWPDFNLKPRYRPVSGWIPFSDLDLIEQIPYDISALWGGCYDLKTEPLWKVICFKLVYFVVSAHIHVIIFVGPVIYRWKPSRINDIEDFMFFDCLGPLIFYHLTAFSIIWWSCATRIYIWPKEHELLYFELIVNRPIRRKDASNNRNIRRTDWAALQNISCATRLNTFLYSFRKGFLELKTPTHELLSLRPIQTHKWKMIATTVVNIALLFFAHNLENLQVTGSPFHFSANDVYYDWKLIYNISSQCLSCLFLFGFILLWETMFDRIDRHLDAITTLRNLLIRNTYSEYIRLSATDNILSWMIMERFLKRKGMMLFSSLEAPLFALAVLFVTSWAGIIYGLYEGVGQQIHNESSTFSNSALATWLYLGCFACYQTGRMLFYYGRQFTRETESIDNAFKRSAKTLHIENLMQYQVNNRYNTMDEKYAMKSSQYILSHSNYDEIVPKVFGIQFDKLTAKAAWGLCISTFPTILKIMGQALGDRLEMNF
eukprot:975505_1